MAFTTLNHINHQPKYSLGRALVIILVAQVVDTDVILQKPYDSLIHQTNLDA